MCKIRIPQNGRRQPFFKAALLVGFSRQLYLLVGGVLIRTPSSAHHEVESGPAFTWAAATTTWAPYQPPTTRYRLSQAICVNEPMLLTRPVSGTVGLSYCQSSIMQKRNDEAEITMVLHCCSISSMDYHQMHASRGFPREAFPETAK